MQFCYLFLNLAHYKVFHYSVHSAHFFLMSVLTTSSLKFVFLSRLLGPEVWLASSKQFAQAHSELSLCIAIYVLTVSVVSSLSSLTMQLYGSKQRISRKNAVLEKRQIEKCGKNIFSFLPLNSSPLVNHPLNSLARLLASFFRFTRILMLLAMWMFINFLALILTLVLGSDYLFR